MRNGSYCYGSAKRKLVSNGRHSGQKAGGRQRLKEWWEGKKMGWEVGAYRGVGGGKECRSWAGV